MLKRWSHAKVRRARKGGPPKQNAGARGIFIGRIRPATIQFFYSGIFGALKNTVHLEGAANRCRERHWRKVIPALNFRTRNRSLKYQTYGEKEESFKRIRNDFPQA